VELCGFQVVFDVQGASVSQPFQSLTVALRAIAWKLDLKPGGPELQRLRDAYLEPFGEGITEAPNLGYRTGAIARALASHRMVAAREPRFVDEDDATVAAYGLKLFLERPDRNLAVGSARPRRCTAGRSLCRRHSASPAAARASRPVNSPAPPTRGSRRFGWSLRTLFTTEHADSARISSGASGTVAPTVSSKSAWTDRGETVPCRSRPAARGRLGRVARDTSSGKESDVAGKKRPKSLAQTVKKAPAKPKRPKKTSRGK
jgi:hypothetical protein